jgi:hypothetical protein
MTVDHSRTGSSVDRGTASDFANFRAIKRQGDEVTMQILDCLTTGAARRLTTWCLSGLIVFVAAGCTERSPLEGLKLYPAKGKVLLADGKPLTSGRVVFVSIKPPATAAADIGSDGGFAFKGIAGDGLPEAEYKIRIEPGSSVGVKATKSKSTLPFASNYLDEDYSELKATVTADESKNYFEFKLTTKSPAESSHGRGGR